MAKEPNPLDKLTVLAGLLRDSVADLGLHMHSFTVTPSPDPGHIPHTAEVMFLIDVDAVMADPEQKEVDTEFDAMVAGMAVDEVDEKRQAAIEDLKASLAGGGLFDDDEDDA